VKGDNMKTKGTVIWFDQTDGIGIIKDTQCNEIFFDSSVLQDRAPAEIFRGDTVEFTKRKEHKVTCALEVFKLN
jgi:cold shock CspA family protein